MPRPPRSQASVITSLPSSSASSAALVTAPSIPPQCSPTSIMKSPPLTSSSSPTVLVTAPSMSLQHSPTPVTMPPPPPPNQPRTPEVGNATVLDMWGYPVKRPSQYAASGSSSSAAAAAAASTVATIADRFRHQQQQQQQQQQQSSSSMYRFGPRVSDSGMTFSGAGFYPGARAEGAGGGGCNHWPAPFDGISQPLQSISSSASYASDTIQRPPTPPNLVSRRHREMMEVTGGGLSLGVVATTSSSYPVTQPAGVEDPMTTTTTGSAYQLSHPSLGRSPNAFAPSPSRGCHVASGPFGVSLSCGIRRESTTIRRSRSRSR